jgi:transcriptional regulator with XRE-family HTH domain
MASKRAPPPDVSEQVIMKKAGARVRALRRLDGWTQEQAAAATGVLQSDWSKVERGVKMPPLLPMIVFAQRYRVSLDFIYLGKPDGVHPLLLPVLLEEYPQLVAPATHHTVASTGTALAAYKDSIRE